MDEAQQNNMISNLPLLFANGYPTSLEKIGEEQLQNFIPFMVQCSLGFINLQGKIDCSEPEWWPEDLPFTNPFSKPKKFHENWMEKMREIVIICYHFHKSLFLLRFCTDLASYEHASLRFINNSNSTTSLFDRRNNKLLVTFRNENMSYDQPQRSRMCLMQQKSKNGHQSEFDGAQMMVEPAPFDIYLCDNCDAELYSKEAIFEHEKTCNVDTDDIILCDTPEPIEEINGQSNEQNIIENNELRINFLQNFNLQFCHESKKKRTGESYETNTLTKKEDGFMILDRNKRLPRRNRAVHSLTRCPTIPLSSPAGQLLLRSIKSSITMEYLNERYERVERFCHTVLLSKSTSRPKYMEKKHIVSHPNCTFKKPQDYSAHIYIFPRRQYSQRKRTESLLYLNSLLIKRCRPISVRLKKLNSQSSQEKHITSGNAKLNIKLTRDAKESSNWKISPATSTEVIVDTIDLCSSEDEDCINKCVNKKISSTNELELSKNEKIANVSPRKDKVKLSNNKTTFCRTRLKKMNDRLNSLEVSLIPIRKPLANSVKQISINSKITKVSTNNCSEAATTGSEVNSNNISSHYEGNIVFSNSPVSPFQSNLTLQKSLKPSMYVLPNYMSTTTANSLSAIISKSNDCKNQNQENQLDSNISNNGNKRSKHTKSVASPNNSEWFVGGSSLGVAHTHSNFNNHNQMENSDRSSFGLGLVQAFGSPNRIISIDLTS